jgi:hypothetical protein
VTTNDGTPTSTAMPPCRTPAAAPERRDSGRRGRRPSDSESRHARKPVEHETSGYGDVEARAASNHRDLDASIGRLDLLLRDSVPLVAEEDDGPPSCGLEPRKRDRAHRQFHDDGASRCKPGTVPFLFLPGSVGVHVHEALAHCPQRGLCA